MITLKQTHLFNFKTKSFTSFHFSSTRDYIVGFELYQKGKDFDAYICLFDKSLVSLKRIPFGNYWIDRFFVRPDDNVIAAFPSIGDHIIIFDLDTQKKIVISNQEKSFSDGLTDDENGLFTSVYHWKKDRLLLLAYQGKYLVHTAKYTLEKLNPESELPRGWYIREFVSKFNKCKGEIYYNSPDFNEFVFYNKQKKRIGFINIKQKIVKYHAYTGDDIHEIFFYQDSFIIPHCNTIEIVSKDNTYNAFSFPQKSHLEFRGSYFMKETNEIISVIRYWHKSVIKFSLAKFKIESNEE